MFLYSQDARRKNSSKKTIYRRVERCIKMKYLRFTTDDDNYTHTATEHNWEIPLNLENKKIGLSSFFVILKDNPNSKPVISIRCNLIDATMENQKSILELIPVAAENQSLFARSSKNIGM